MPGTAGITQAVLADTTVIPYNDPEKLDEVLSTGEYACFIVEPVMENIGICLPLPRLPRGGPRDHAHATARC